ncbi:MAG: hypothetical protein LRY73_11450 [Bacillus sp. (in: Bacteria)]|nr:hypothetical protein [Bacillus sp. (in: firmicutes)]
MNENKTFDVYWSQTALDELANILAYPPEVKEKIYLDSLGRLSVTPTIAAKRITHGFLAGYWVRLGLYQVMLVFEINNAKGIVWIDGIKHKRENVYWKRN